MSMNFNNSGSSPISAPSPKKNNKLIVEIVIAVVIASIAATVIMGTVMEAQNKMDRVFSPSSNYKPSVQEVREKCIETLRDMLDTEPPKLSVNICVGTVLQELNK